MPVLDFVENRPPVRHIISLDGTWQTADQETPTNIKLLHDSLAARGTDGMAQRRKYFSGVATEGGWFRRAWNGVTGADLEQKVCEAYSYLSENYRPGDKVVFIGGSRGAYTARTLNGMIYKSGLVKDGYKLEPEGLAEKAKLAFDYYRNDDHPQSVEAEIFRQENSYHSRPKISLGIFDTVGSLGIPIQFKILNKITSWRFNFHDTTLNENTEYAFNAVAIDEQRKNFMPTPMELAKGAKTYLKEKYFAGNHGAVIGGSKENRGLSDIAGDWMAKKFTEFLNVGFDAEKLETAFNPDPLANPNTNFKPKSAWWDLAGFKSRFIPDDPALLHESVLKRRFNEVAGYQPKHIEPLLKRMVANSEVNSPQPNALSVG